MINVSLIFSPYLRPIILCFLFPVWLGKKIKDGDEIVVLSIGHPGNFVIEAEELLQKKGINIGHYNMIFLKPIDERLREEIISNKYEELIFVESNYSGQVEKHLSNELGLKFIPNLKISNLRKYDLFPFYIEDFNELLNK